MLKNAILNRGLIPLSLAVAASAGLMTATPAHAGPLDFLKKEAVKAAKKEAKKQVETRAAGGYLQIGDIKGESEAASQDEGGGGIFNNGGTRANSRFDDTDIPHATTRASGVRVAAGDVNADSSQPEPKISILTGLLLPAVQKASVNEEPASSREGLSQNGTTVPTADEVQAPQRPQRAKLKQTGTTVATASEVQAPEARPERAKLKQNGTTVETASEVQAPQTEEQAGLLLPAVQKVREAAAR